MVVQSFVGLSFWTPYRIAQKSMKENALFVNEFKGFDL